MECLLNALTSPVHDLLCLPAFGLVLVVYPPKRHELQNPLREGIQPFALTTATRRVADHIFPGYPIYPFLASLFLLAVSARNVINATSSKQKQFTNNNGPDALEALALDRAL